MSNNSIKMLFSAAVIVILFVIAIKILNFAITVLLPIAIIIIAAYILYIMVLKGRR